MTQLYEVILFSESKT